LIVRLLFPTGKLAILPQVLPRDPRRLESWTGSF